MRGASQVLQWYDEFSFMKYNDIIFKAASLANQESCREAIISKKPYGRLFTTTAGDLRYEHGRWSHEFFGRACKFDESFYDMTLKDVKERIRKNAKNNMVYIEFSYKQLGRSEEYFIEQCEALDYDQLKIQREVLNVWCSSADSCPFRPEDLAKVQKYLKDPIAHLLLNQYYSLEIYEDFNWNDAVMLGADVAAGLSLDNTALTIMDPRTFKVLAHLRSNNIDPLDFADVLIELMTKYLPRSILFCERNADGKDVLSYINKIAPQLNSRIYGENREKVAEKTVKDPKNRSLRTSKGKNKVFQYGIDTTKNTRPQMIDILFKVIRYQPETIVSKWIFDDLNGMERKVTKTNEKIEHSATTHDDSVFSFLMPKWAWVYGTNMQHYYLGYTPDNSEEEGYSETRHQSFVKTVEQIERLNRKPKITSPDFETLLRQQEDIDQNVKPITKRSFKQSVWDMNKL